MKSATIFSMVALLGLLFMYSCNSSDVVINGNWSISPDYGGNSRGGAFQFTIGDRVYIGLGVSGQTSLYKYYSDGFSFSVADGFWKQMAAFPGTQRESMFSFALNGKGYIGAGFNRSLNPGLQVLTDVWEYTPETDSWAQVADYPHIVYGCVAFSTAQGAFVGAGFDTENWYNDFYEYDQANDAWTQIASIPSKRRNAGSFVVNGKAYVYGGDNNGTATVPTFYEFDPAVKTWTSKAQATTNSNYADFSASVRRSNSTAFTLKDLAYIVCGASNGISQVTLVYQYDPLTDVWTKMTGFEGSSRQYANSFVLNDRAFVGLGTNGTTAFSDVWEWKPLDAFDALN